MIRRLIRGLTDAARQNREAYDRMIQEIMAYDPMIQAIIKQAKERGTNPMKEGSDRVINATVESLDDVARVIFGAAHSIKTAAEVLGRVTAEDKAEPAEAPVSSADVIAKSSTDSGVDWGAAFDAKAKVAPLPGEPPWRLSLARFIETYDNKIAALNKELDQTRNALAGQKQLRTELNDEFIKLQSELKSLGHVADLIDKEAPGEASRLGLHRFTRIYATRITSLRRRLDEMQGPQGSIETLIVNKKRMLNELAALESEAATFRYVADLLEKVR